MKRIASVTFYNPNTELGGGCTPAFALADWFEIIYKGGEKIDVLYNPSPEQLNEYEAVFFATPPRSPEWNFRNLKVPFVVMIHVHNDLLKYPWFHYMTELHNCFAVVQIENDANFFGYLKKHVPVFPWTHCVQPKFLHQAQTPVANESMLYASRVCSWKNAHLAVEIDKNCVIYGTITDKEYAKKHGIKSEKFTPVTHPAQSGIYDVIFNSFGNYDTPMIVKRLDLTAWEAMHYGVMPIVNPDAMPESLRWAFIEIDPMNFNKKTAIRRIEEYRESKQYNWDRMKSIIAESEFSYENVRNQMQNIMGLLTDACI